MQFALIDLKFCTDVGWMILRSNFKQLFCLKSLFWPWRPLEGPRFRRPEMQLALIDLKFCTDVGWMILRSNFK